MEINFPPSVAKNGTKYLDRIVLSGDRLVERKHVQYRAAQFMFGFDLSRGEEMERESCGARRSIVGFIEIV